MAAHLAAVEGLDADDGDDEGSRHLIGLLGPRQGGGVALPEADPVPDPLRGDEQRPVAMPGFGLPGAADGVEYLLAQAGLGGGGLQLGQRHLLLLGEPGEPGGLDGRRCVQGNEREQHTSQSHQASNLLWVWMDIRMPKPAIRVTMEVPP